MKITLIATIMFCASAVIAQPLGPGRNPDIPPPSGAAPIDGGVSLLVAGAIGYGAKKVRDARKKRIQKTGRYNEE